MMNIKHLRLKLEFMLAKVFFYVLKYGLIDSTPPYHFLKIGQKYGMGILSPRHVYISPV